MENRSYLPSSHHLLPVFSPLTSPTRPSLSTSSNRRSSPPPEFSYDVGYPRDQSLRVDTSSPRGSERGRFGSNRSLSGNSSLNMAYSSVQDFPYGISGVQMPTYNFGSELFNYVSNGFPRKSRICTFCNKVFTRSTTRRYHEKRCPLLRASNSLAKNEENNQASTLSALKEQQSQQQQQHQRQQLRQKESPGGNGISGARSANSHHSSSLPRTLSSNITNTTSAQSAGSVPQASPPLQSLHPAYPTSFSKSAAALVSSPSRSSAYNYAHPYSSDFYNSLSAAALASLDKNINSSSKHHHPHHQHQPQPHPQESEKNALSWKAASASPPTPNSNLQEQMNPFTSKLSASLSGNGPLSFSKGFSSEAVMDLATRYTADFGLRTSSSMFPAPSLRIPPRSPSSLEPGETHNQFQGQDNPRYRDELLRVGSGRDGCREDRRVSRESRDSPDEGVGSLMSPQHSNKLLWQMNGGVDKDKVTSSSYNSMLSPSSSLPVDGYRRQHSSPSSDTTWQGDKDGLEPRAPFMKVEPLDEDDEDEFEDDDDEEEVEEDEEQFKNENDVGHSEAGVEDDDGLSRERRMSSSSMNKNASYNDLVCQFCEKLFADKVTRKAHEALHSQKKLYSCCLCPSSFHCGYSLRVHTMRNHKEGPFKCKYCFLNYGPASEFRSHLIKEHSLPKTEYQSLKFFSMITNSDSNSPCPESMVSSYAVSEGEHDDEPANGSGSAFKLHRRSADHPEEHYKFSDETTKALLSPNRISSVGSTSNLAPPTNVKSGADEDMETCKVCNKSFTKSYIRLHERAHADQKPYECPICNKRFGYKNNMKSHMKLHQGLKPYRCQICGATFTRGSTLRRHGRRHNISNGAMLDYVLYDRANARGGGAAAAAMAQHTTSMVPNSLLVPKSHYLLPTSHSNTNSNNAISTNNSVPASQLTPHSKHPQPSTPHPSDSFTHPKHHHPLHSAITSRHSAFGPMPSLIPATGANLGSGLENDRFGITNGNSNNNGIKQKSPNHHLSPTGSSPRAANGPHLPFTSPNSITNPMVGGLAAVAAANLFGYPNAATAPQLYQFYASAAAAANPLMGYASYSANPNLHGVQSDALNLSLNKRKVPCKTDDVDDSDVDDDEVKDRTSDPKLPRLMDDSNRKMTSPNDEQNFADSSSGVSSVSSDSKSMIKRETSIKEDQSSAPYSNEIKFEMDNDPDANLNNFTKSLSPVSPPHKNLSPRADSDIKYDSENDEGVDELSDTKHKDPHRHHHHHHHHHHPYRHHDNGRGRDKVTHHRESPDANSDDRLSLKISSEDFGAQVNICCPSPQVQSSTGSVSAHHSPMSQTCSNNSPVGSSSGPDSLLLNNQSVTSPTGSGVTSQACSPANSNTAPSPTLNAADSGQDILLSLLSSGRLFRCSFCDIYFTEYAMFRLHQKYHESDVDRPFLCAVCREDCKDKTYFTVHLSEHLGLGPKNGLP